MEICLVPKLNNRFRSFCKFTNYTFGKNFLNINLFACLKRFDMTCGSEDKKNQIVNFELDNSNHIIIFFFVGRSQNKR